MIHQIRGDNDVANIQAAVQGTGDAGVDDMGDAKTVRQNLNTQGGVDLADAADHHHAVHTAKAALIKGTARFNGRNRMLHFCLQGVHFFVHGPNNTDFHSPILL